MKKSIIIVIFLFLNSFLFTACSSDNDNDDDDEQRKPEFPKDINIIGKLVCISNPCIEEPCLPGIIAAIKTDSLDYVISVNGVWLVGNQESIIVMDNDTLNFNDSLEVFGTISKKQDIYSQNYYEIEIKNFTKL